MIDNIVALEWILQHVEHTLFICVFLKYYTLMCTPSSFCCIVIACMYACKLGFGQWWFIPLHHFKGTPHLFPVTILTSCLSLRSAVYLAAQATKLLLCSLAHCECCFCSHSAGVYSWLAVNHGYQHVPKDDLFGCPESVQLCGRGEPGCHQSAFGHVHGCGQQEWCKPHHSSLNVGSRSSGKNKQ